ncbi:methyl-accepting chemotaxis protein [Ktedonosporobacter rubrisoli]|uniref:Methyl-accepting chemotaxis protein n=2 Tax=Ktedonosporobacter rubrisoli TaxID=2509675 RepID=A0A4P6K6C4_KTERU|nr:methyl-accepting chemotaxis protein [Ktedonosporobacter rubrisoli]
MYPRPPKDEQNWSPGDVVEQEEKKNNLVQWWYNLTSIPEVPINASFMRREAARKSHLLSTLIFWLLVVFVLFIPGCLALPNRYVLVADLGMMVICVIALFFNKSQKPLLAGILLTAAFELALTMVIFTTWPLDEPSIQQYELFVFGELLCVSLLAPSSVFIVMIYNIMIITVSLIWQPHTAILIQDLQTQFAPIWVRPAGVQILVAFVSYLWVKSATKAIARADRAEMIAKLEHEMASQRRELEEGIQQILQTHVEIANGNLNARAPLNQDNVLWQIARALNTLLVRLQRASLAEKELRRVEQAVEVTVQTIQEADKQNEAARISFTQTEIDPLIAALQGKNIAYTPAPFAQRAPRQPDPLQVEMSPYSPYPFRQP